MNLKQFKAGAFTNQYGYNAFDLNVLDKEWIVDNPQIKTLFEDATYY